VRARALSLHRCRRAVVTANEPSLASALADGCCFSDTLERGRGREREREREGEREREREGEREGERERERELSSLPL